MAISDATKALIADGIWASSEAADRETPENLGIRRIDGWTVAYEQPGSGREPERTLFNEQGFEQESAIHDIVGFGVLAWDAGVDYVHDDTGHAFATTSTGLWVSERASGPARGNATNPDTPGQTVWRRY